MSGEAIKILSGIITLAIVLVGILAASNFIKLTPYELKEFQTYAQDACVSNGGVQEINISRFLQQKKAYEIICQDYKIIPWEFKK